MRLSTQDRPKTLLELAGRPNWIRPAKAVAVVIIDAQGEYRDGALPLEGIDAALGEIAALRKVARNLGWPLLHVRHVGQAGGLFDPSARGGAFLEGAEPEEGETVIDKRLPNAFAGTALGEHLSGEGIKHLVLAGFMTHMCVSATARAALDQGFSSAIVAAACATRALPAHDGGIIEAAELNRAALAALGDRFAHIVADAGSL